MPETVDIDGHRATVTYDAEIGMYRGEFIGLNGGADFYATTREQLVTEGRRSLQVFLEACREHGLPPG